MHRGPEIGRLSECVQKSHDYDDQVLFNNKLQRMLVLAGCGIFLLCINSKMKIVSQLQRSKIEKVSVRRTRVSRRCLNLSQQE